MSSPSTQQTRDTCFLQNENFHYILDNSGVEMVVQTQPSGIQGGIQFKMKHEDIAGIEKAEGLLLMLMAKVKVAEAKRASRSMRSVRDAASLRSRGSSVGPGGAPPRCLLESFSRTVTLWGWEVQWRM